MKSFWEKHSYDIVKLMLDQFAIAVFGIVLAISIGKAQNETFQVIASVAAIVFYLFLHYTVCWQAGAQAKIRIEGGRERENPLLGLYMALFANLPNLILAILVTVGKAFSYIEAFGQIGAVSGVIALFWEGMYTGLLAVDVAGNALNSYALSYFLIILPSLAVCTVAYYCGIRGIHATNILIAETPEDIERRKEAREKKKHKDEEE